MRACRNSHLETEEMKPLNLVTQALLVIGGLNWGLVGLIGWNLVAAVFGDGSILSRLVYVVVGVSALWQLGRLFMRRGDLRAAWDAA